MPEFTPVSLKEAKAQGKYLSEYVSYIEQVPPGEAGKLHLADEEDPVAIRRRLILAAQALDVRLGIKRSGLDLYFWLETPTTPDERPRRRRGRPRRVPPVGEELLAEEDTDLVITREDEAPA